MTQQSVIAHDEHIHKKHVELRQAIHLIQELSSLLHAVGIVDVSWRRVWHDALIDHWYDARFQ